MKKFDGYLLDKRIGDLLMNLEILPVYVKKEFDKHFSSDAILAAWIQWNTFQRDATMKDYIEYIFAKASEFDRKNELYLAEIDFHEDYGWHCKIDYDHVKYFN